MRRPLQEQIRYPFRPGAAYLRTMPIPAPGSTAPAFRAPVAGGSYPEGSFVSLADLKGRTVVLYFYPKDDTPGCTTQACALRDAWDRVQAKAAVFGVSVDPLKSHTKFIQKHALPFPLLSVMPCRLRL